LPGLDAEEMKQGNFPLLLSGCSKSYQMISGESRRQLVFLASDW